jgi:hypothetical protein
MINKDGIEFIERFLEDEEKRNKVLHSLAGNEEVAAATTRYSAHFAFRTWDDPGIGRDLNSEKWLAYMEEASPRIRKRPVFMIREFRKEERAIFQFYLGSTQTAARDNFNVMLFAENKNEGFKFISKYRWNNDWDISEDLNDEMVYWGLYKGEHLPDRGTLIATVRYKEPYKEEQKKVYFMEP